MAGSGDSVVRLEEQMKYLVETVTDIKRSLEKVSDENKDLIKEVRHEFKADIFQLKEDHCTRLNTHSETLKVHEKGITEINSNTKWVSGIVSAFVTIAGFFLSRLWK